MKLYHQTGWNSVWNFDSYKDDNTGDGFIISARYHSRDTVQGLSANLKSKSIFDPQFFFPEIDRGELSTYNFFPEKISGGFDTDDFSKSFASESAKRCIDFQIENNFEYLTIPMRLIEGNRSNFIEEQTRLFIEPFLNAIKDSGYRDKVLLQFLCTESMLKDEETFTNILSWLTFYTEINGIYLILYFDQNDKQIKDTELLLKLLKLIDVIKSNQLELVLGYTNTESYLLSIAEPDIITMGAYENTRSFKKHPFQVKTDRIAQPVPRVYSYSLLQWIRYEYIGAIKTATDLDRVFHENIYREDLLSPEFNPHFTKPSLYKHYFQSFDEQINEIKGLSGKELYNSVRSTVNNGMILSEELTEDYGIRMTSDSDTSHLQPWYTVINIYGKNKGYR